MCAWGENAVWDEELSIVYDPDSGRVWKIKELKTTQEYEGRVSATTIAISGLRRMSTHVIWKIMKGQWPREGMVIDHKDGNVANNKIENLREATISQNGVNRESNGRSGLYTPEGLAMGVYVMSNGNYRVQFKINNQTIYFGTYKTVKEANEIAVTKRKEIYGDFIRKENSTCE